MQLDTQPPTEIARLNLPEGTRAKLDGAFRYLPLAKPVPLLPGKRYALLATTRTGDGDHFKSLAAFDGLSPLVHPDVEIIRSLLIRHGNLAHPQSIPAFSDLSPHYSRHRLPVGPTLKFHTP